MSEEKINKSQKLNKSTGTIIEKNDSSAKSVKSVKSSEATLISTPTTTKVEEKCEKTSTGSLKCPSTTNSLKESSSNKNLKECSKKSLSQSMKSVHPDASSILSKKDEVTSKLSVKADKAVTVKGSTASLSKAAESKCSVKAAESKCSVKAAESKCSVKAAESKCSVKAAESKCSVKDASVKAAESKCSVKAVESKCSVKAAESKCSVKDASVKAAESKCSVKAAESKCSVKAAESKCSVKAAESKCSVKDASVKAAESKCSVKAAESKCSVKEASVKAAETKCSVKTADSKCSLKSSARGSTKSVEQDKKPLYSTVGNSHSISMTSGKGDNLSVVDSKEFKIIETSLRTTIPASDIKLEGLEKGYVMRVTHSHKSGSPDSCYESTFEYCKEETFEDKVKCVKGAFNKNGNYEIKITFAKKE